MLGRGEAAGLRCGRKDAIPAIPARTIPGTDCRVGTTQDIVARGAPMPTIIQAGRWSPPAMAAQYGACLDPDRSAVFKYLGLGLVAEVFLSTLETKGLPDMTPPQGDHIPAWMPRGPFGTIRLPLLTSFSVSPARKEGLVGLALEAIGPDDAPDITQRAAITMTPEQVNALMRDLRLALKDIE